jgi:hypothetical protein
MSRWTPLTAAAVLCVFALGCAAAPPAGNPETGYAIFGFVGQSSSQAAPGETVIIVDSVSGQAVKSTTTNFMGKYTVANLPPGHYLVRAGEVERETVLSNENQRLDIDLSVPSGVMDYTKTGMAKTGGGDSTAPAGPNDADLAQQIAGIWWGYSGSTETRIALCSDGSFQDFSESSYSGKFDHDGGAWGTAGQKGGSGSWTIQGDTQSGTITLQYAGGTTRSFQYRQTGETGCLYFDQIQLCRTQAECD